MRWLPILFIRLYARLVSPLLPATCRYLPSCSAYAEESYRVHGLLKGTVLILLRLLRCHPWSATGYDPVPPRGCWRHPARDLRR